MMCCIELGDCMDEKKKELQTNLISSFLILLSFCLVIALLINLKFQQDCATVIVGMLGVCATLYAPVAAFFLYDSWKEQKNFDTDLELLKECDENHIRLKKELDIICNKIIKIYNEYENNKNYYIAHSLYKKNLELESKYLDNFFIHISRYLNFHEDKQFSLLVNEYHSMVIEILYINKDFVTEIYKPIYDEIKKYSNIDLVDSTLLISFPPNQEGTKRYLTQKYRVLRTNYINTGYLTEINKETKKEEDILLNYEEYYKLMGDYYSKINIYIKEKIRA